MTLLYLALVALFAGAPWAHAGAEAPIIRGIQEVLKTVVLITGPSVLGYGLVRGFIAYGAGDEDGMQTARNAVIGGLGILFTFQLVKMVIQASGVSG